MRESRAPLIIAIVILALPMMYVGSYLVLVVPAGVPYAEFNFPCNRGFIYSSYRCGKDLPERVYWPLEQVDRRLRPAAWPVEEKLGIEFDE